MPDVESIEILSPFIDCIDGTKPAVVIIAALESMESLFSSRVFGTSLMMMVVYTII